MSIRKESKVTGRNGAQAKNKAVVVLGSLPHLAPGHMEDRAQVVKEGQDLVTAADKVLQQRQRRRRDKQPV